MQQVDLDALPFAGALAVAQGGEDPDRREQAREHVDQCHADLLGLAVGLAGDAHQATNGLHEQVVARQHRAGAGAEAGDRAVDQRLVVGAELVIAEPQLVHHAGPEVLHDHVGYPTQMSVPSPAPQGWRDRG